MKTFIVLLRAVNVSGKNLIKMSEFAVILQQAGFESVKTYIQSGNILLNSTLKEKEVQDEIKICIAEHFGLDIHVFVFDHQKLNYILQHNPFSKMEQGNKIIITLLDKIPHQKQIDKLKYMDLGIEEYQLNQDTFYYYVPEGMTNSRLSNAFIESKLKVIATGRNLNTMMKLKEFVEQVN